MTRKAKLAPGSLLTTDDQVKLYAEQMGEAKAAEQARLAAAKAGRCTCQPSGVRRRWEGEDKATIRRVHAPECARWKPWMAEARS